MCEVDIPSPWPTTTLEIIVASQNEISYCDLECEFFTKPAARESFTSLVSDALTSQIRPNIGSYVQTAHPKGASTVGHYTV